MNTESKYKEQLQNLEDTFSARGVKKVRLYTDDAFESLSEEERAKEIVTFMNSAYNRKTELLFSGNLKDFLSYVKESIKQ